MVEYIKKLERSPPSDVIQLTHETDLLLADLWVAPQNKATDFRTATLIPSDLLISGTVPLLDCKIMVSEHTEEHGPMTAEFRVKIFTDYHASLRDDKVVRVGILQIHIPNGSVCTVPLVAGNGVNHISWVSNEWWRECERLYPSDGIVTARLLEHLDKIAFMCLATWYGIQIALLHPVVKNVFSTPARIPQKTKTTKAKKHGKRTPVKYVKRHIINQTELKELVYGKPDGKHYRRKALIWHVIGHWRTYKNGHKVFIQPYWKGSLRDTGHPKSRERELILQ